MGLIHQANKKKEKKLDIQKAFEQNLKYISKQEMNVEEIKKQNINNNLNDRCESIEKIYNNKDLEEAYKKNNQSKGRKRIRNRNKINLGKINKKDENINQIIDRKKEKNIEKEYLPIYELLSNKPIHINEIAKKLNMTIQEIAPTITIMEIKEYASQIQTNYFVKKE